MDVPREMGKKTKEKGEMKMLILTSLVLIIVLLAFIAFMVFAIGRILDEKNKK